MLCPAEYKGASSHLLVVKCLTISTFSVLCLLVASLFLREIFIIQARLLSIPPNICSQSGIFAYRKGA